MSINVKNFVDINIAHHEVSSVDATRDTAVLFTSEGDTGTDEIFTSTNDFLAAYPDTLTATLKYVQMFFNNAGNKLRVIQGIETQDDLSSAIAALPNEQIVVAYCGDQSFVKSVAQTREVDTRNYGVNRKLLLMGVTTNTDETSVADLAMKYTNDISLGAEMTIAAYLTSINIYGTNTIHDYAFTKENIDAMTDDDATYRYCMQNNINVDVYLAGSVRNVGGNLKNGLDLANEFTLIVLQQTCTDRLLNLLVEKLKGEQGLASIYSVLSEELDKYVTNRYLTTDKIWTNGDLNITYNGASYNIIRNNTQLNLGYYITILPLASLSTTDKVDKKTPPIYLIVADSYGIRKITINGEVF